MTLTGPTPFKGILLDIGGTLDADGEHWRSRFYKLFLERGYRIDPQVFNRIYFDADDRLSQDYPLGTMGLHETILALADSIGRRLPETWKVTHPIAEDFYESALFYINRNKKVLARLRKQYRVALVSNYYGNLLNAVSETGLDRFVDATVDSDRIGSRKPDPVIFWTALEAIGVPPAQAIFVGDSFHRDIKGAERVGITPVWIRSSNGGGMSTRIACLNSFVKLPHLLEAGS